MEQKNTVHSPNSPHPDEHEGQLHLGHGLVIGPTDNNESGSKDYTPSSSKEQGDPECVDLESPSFSVAGLSQNNVKKSLSSSNVPLPYFLKKETTSDPLVRGSSPTISNTGATSTSAPAVVCSTSQDKEKTSDGKSIAERKLCTLHRRRPKNAGDRALRLQESRRSRISKHSPGVAKNALLRIQTDLSVAERKSLGAPNARSVRFAVFDSQASKSSDAYSMEGQRSELAAALPPTSIGRVSSEPVSSPTSTGPSNITSFSQKKTCPGLGEASACDASRLGRDASQDTNGLNVGAEASDIGKVVENSMGSQAERGSLFRERSPQTDLLTTRNYRSTASKLSPCNSVLNVGMDISDPSGIDLDQSLDFDEELEISSLQNIPSLSPLTKERLGIASDGGESIALGDKETENPSEADKVFSYLQSLPVLRLRAFCKELKVKQSGVKNILVDRVFFAMSEQGAGEECTSDLSARDLSRTCGARDYNGWLLDNSSRDVWKIATSAEEGICDETAIPNFSLDEYARLLVLLTTNDALRSTLIQSGLEKERAQLDLHIPRERFWVVKVKPVFNDASVKPVMDFTGKLSNVDCSRKPLAYRTGVELKKQYEFVKRHFTTAYAEILEIRKFWPQKLRKFLLQDIRGRVKTVCNWEEVLPYVPGLQLWHRESAR